MFEYFVSGLFVGRLPKKIDGSNLGTNLLPACELPERTKISTKKKQDRGIIL